MDCTQVIIPESWVGLTRFSISEKEFSNKKHLEEEILPDLFQSTYQMHYSFFPLLNKSFVGFQEYLLEFQVVHIYNMILKLFNGLILNVITILML